MYQLGRYFLLFAFVGSSSAQNLNYLEPEEFNSIMVRDVPWLDIVNTNGDPNEMKKLFGDNLNYEYLEEPQAAISYGVLNDSLVFYFEDYRENGIYTLSSMGIYNDLHYITIRGARVAVGDNISIIKNAFNESLIQIALDDFNKISFGITGRSESLGIYFDKNSGEITRIKYNNYN